MEIRDKGLSGKFSFVVYCLKCGQKRWQMDDFIRSYSPEVV